MVPQKFFYHLIVLGKLPSSKSTSMRVRVSKYFHSVITSWLLSLPTYLLNLLKCFVFNQVNEGLPATAYIKMIDVWLIFNLIIPFILIVIHTYMDTLRP